MDSSEQYTLATNFVINKLDFLGYKSRDQKEVIKDVLSKLELGEKNFIISMATQAGKSLIYQVLGNNLKLN